MKQLGIKVIFIIAMVCYINTARAQLDAEVDAIRQQYNLMGISVVTICNGAPGDTCHAGIRDYTRGLPVNDSTMYRIASISKLVTAMGLMKLYDAGEFNLDDDVGTYLGYTFRNPYFPNVPVTFRMLLSHTSGIQDGSGYSSFLGATYNNSNPPSIASLFVSGGSYYTSDMWMNKSPGTYFTYSNANYGVIASLLEKISNQRFDVYMKNEILNPLGIAGSFNINDIANINNVAVLYRKSGSNWSPQADNFQGTAPTPVNLSSYTPGTNGFIFGPQGGLRISPSDLARLMMMLLNDGMYNGISVLNSSTVTLMQSPAWTYNGSNGDNYYGLFRSWGLGMHITTLTAGGDIVYPATVMIGHPGEAYGLISDFYFDPVHKNGIVFMTNGAFDGYDFGTNSAFYTVEESVFDAAYQHSHLPCIALSAFDQSTQTIRLYPNPASDHVTLEVNSCSGGTIHLTDCTGKILMSLPFTQQTIPFSVKHLPSGCYFLASQDAAFRQKLIIIR